MNKRLSPTRRLFNKYTELQEQMHVLVTHDGSDDAKIKLSRVERRFWPIQAELLRRLDERDELLAEKNDRIARLQTIAARTPGVKPWSSDRGI